MKNSLTHRPNFIDDIAAFHEKFGLTQTPVPAFLDTPQQLFRKEFLREELQELSQAIHLNDLPSALDALVDLVYVALGTAYLMNLPFEKAWEAVHTANMAKQRAASEAESKRGSAYDIIKPQGWTAPDIGGVIDAYQLELGL